MATLLAGRLQSQHRGQVDKLFQSLSTAPRIKRPIEFLVSIVEQMGSVDHVATCRAELVRDNFRIDIRIASDIDRHISGCVCVFLLRNGI
jgi:hypothetical protein